MEIKFEIPEIIIQIGQFCLNAFMIMFSIGMLLLMGFMAIEVWKNRSRYITQWKLKRIKKKELPDNVLKFEKPNTRRKAS